MKGLSGLLILCLFWCGCVSLIGSKGDLVPTESEIDKLYQQRVMTKSKPKDAVSETSIMSLITDKIYKTNQQEIKGEETLEADYKSLTQMEYNPRYYLRKDPNKALMLSVAFPGMGQAYLENYKKGMSFLAVEAILFAATSHNFNRSHYYGSMSKNYLRFYDKFNGFYLSSEEGNAWKKKHMIFGSISLISLGGVHLWNALDAKQSTQSFEAERGLSIRLEAEPSKAALKIGKRP